MGGTTSHKCFGLPVTNDRTARVSQLTSRSYQGIALRLADLIIVDEISMMDALNFECADRVTRDIVGKDIPFGGKVVLCCGEFAQLPPVIPNGCRNEILAASVVSHPLWMQFEKSALHKRWRNVSDPVFQKFCDDLASPENDGFFDSSKFLPDFRTFTTSPVAVDAFLGGFHGFPSTLETGDDFLALAKSRIYVSIVAAYHHASAMELDTAIAQRVRLRLREPVVECLATDTATRGPVSTPEFMEEVSRRNHQIPVSCLRLFRGCKIRLLRNFNISKGLCNGTMLIVRKIGRHFVEAQIISEGDFYGNIEVLFRFKFDVESKALAFSRLQFPIAISFAGTVHRFQGQTVDEEGFLLLDIRNKPFCHGQAYVAYTRARRSNQVLLITLPEAISSKSLMYQELSRSIVPTIPQLNPPPECSDDTQIDFTVVPLDPVTVTSDSWDGKQPQATADMCDEDVDGEDEEFDSMY